jgi:acyl carrier protein
VVVQCDTQMMLEILHTKVGIPLNIPNIETRSWEELGIESLGLTETCTSLELQLGITLPFEEVLKTINIQELVTFVNAVQAA